MPSKRPTNLADAITTSRVRRVGRGDTPDGPCLRVHQEPTKTLNIRPVRLDLSRHSLR